VIKKNSLVDAKKKEYEKHKINLERLLKEIPKFEIKKKLKN